MTYNIWIDYICMYVLMYISHNVLIFQKPQNIYSENNCIKYDRANGLLLRVEGVIYIEILLKYEYSYMHWTKLYTSRFYLNMNIHICIEQVYWYTPKWFMEDIRICQWSTPGVHTHISVIFVFESFSTRVYSSSFALVAACSSFALVAACVSAPGTVAACQGLGVRG